MARRKTIEDTMAKIGQEKKRARLNARRQKHDVVCDGLALASAPLAPLIPQLEQERRGLDALVAPVVDTRTEVQRDLVYDAMSLGEMLDRLTEHLEQLAAAKAKAAEAGAEVLDAKKAMDRRAAQCKEINALIDEDVKMLAYKRKHG